jgi:hypothetical protein
MFPAKTSAQPMTVEAAISNFLISVPPFLGQARLYFLDACSRSVRGLKTAISQVTPLNLIQQPQLVNRVIDLNQIGSHVRAGPIGDSGCGLRTVLQWVRGLTHPRGGLDGHP